MRVFRVLAEVMSPVTDIANLYDELSAAERVEWNEWEVLF